jgi:hypothetical protein
MSMQSLITELLRVSLIIGMVREPARTAAGVAARKTRQRVSVRHWLEIRRKQVVVTSKPTEVVHRQEGGANDDEKISSEQDQFDLSCVVTRVERFLHSKQTVSRRGGSGS